MHAHVNVTLPGALECLVMPFALCRSSARGHAAGSMLIRSTV